MDALSINGLSKSFGTHKVIDHLSFVVPEHSVFGFLGQNGAGKTTTMKMILGLLKQDEGNIKIFGETVTYGQTKTNRCVGYLPDVPEFYGYMKPSEYMKLCGEITGMSNRDIKVKSDELLTLVGLDKVNKRINGFSRGMKQRLGIAQALLSEPRLLICDEPTSALDPVGRKEILDILGQVREKTTVIFSTHILSDVERICDHIAVLHNGKLALSGTLTELKAQHKQDSLLIEFYSVPDIDKFKATIPPSLLLETAMQTDKSLLIKTHDMKATEKAIINVLNKEELLPVKFEVLEPTLEGLFMEVVK